MTKKSTKRALVSSVVSLLICFTMLLGTTFAWFTDSVVSGSNVITAGNLDIEVEYTLGDKDADGNFVWKKLDGANDLFKKGLWEPGHTEVVALKVVNKGTLALKYSAQMNIIDEVVGKTKDGKDIKLSDILMVSTLTHQAIDADGAENFWGAMALEATFNNGISGEGVKFTEGNILNYNGEDEELAPNAGHYVLVQVDMPETVGNEANHDGINVPSIEFGVNVMATQFTKEEDSFGNQYDAGATVPDAPNAKVVKVEGTDKAAVLAAIEKAEPGDIVRLTKDTTIAGYAAEEKLTIEKGIVLDLNGKTITTECGWGGIDLKGGASIINGTINHTGNTAAIKAFQVEKIENVTINVTETAGKTKGGIVVQQGDGCYVGSIKNVTINGATNGIECYRSTNSLAIGSMENVKINATANGIYLNGAGVIGKISNCEISGGNIGINAYLANLWNISLNIENSKISGGTTGIDIWDESMVNTGSTVTFNYDDKTTFTGSRENIKITLQEEITCTENGVKVTVPCDIRK